MLSFKKIVLSLMMLALPTVTFAQDDYYPAAATGFAKKIDLLFLDVLNKEKNIKVSFLQEQCVRKTYGDINVYNKELISTIQNRFSTLLTQQEQAQVDRFFLNTRLSEIFLDVMWDARENDKTFGINSFNHLLKSDREAIRQFMKSSAYQKLFKADGGFIKFLDDIKIEEIFVQKIIDCGIISSTNDL